MKSNTKEILGTTFKSLISNQSCVDGGKNNPVWISIIFLVLSIFLPLIPIIVTASTASGGSFMSTTYRYTFNEMKLTEGFLAMYDTKKYQMRILSDEKNNKELLLYTDGVHTTMPIGDDLHSYEEGYDTYPIYRATMATDPSKGEGKQYALDFYFSDRSFDGDNGKNPVSDLVSVINDRRYKGNTTYKYATEEKVEDGDFEYKPSYIIFYRDGIYARVFKTNSTTAVTASYYGGSCWSNTDLTGFTDLLDKILTVRDKDGTIIPRNVANVTYQKGVYDNLQQVFTETYEPYKWISFRNNILIYGGVFIGMCLLMGLLIFLLTRGKRNPFNYLKWFTCEKIAWYAGLTPGILGLIFGFLLSNQSLLIFIMAFGLRVMWLSMKQLKPTA